MKPRQKSGSSSAVSPKHRDLLERSIERLSVASTTEPPEPVTGLAGLYYHPQRACRTLSFLLSAAFDAVHERTDSATAKLQRAFDLETLLDPEGPGEGLIQELRERYDGDASVFIGILTGSLIPHFVAEIDALEAKFSSEPKVVVQPRSLEDGEELPMERLSPSQSTPRDEEGHQEDQYDPDGADAEPFSSEEENRGESILETANAIAHSENETVDELIETVDTVDVEEHDESDTDAADDPVIALDAEEIVVEADDSDLEQSDVPSAIEEEVIDEVIESTSLDEPSVDEAPSSGRQPYGVSDDEEREAMVAALAVMESDETEEVVQRGRRFDPDVDLAESDDSSKRRRRRRSKSAEGLEWRTVDSTDDLPRAEEVARAAAAAAGAAGVENLAEAIAKRYEIVDADCVAEGIMGAGRILLRELNIEELSGRVRVEITVTPELGEAKPRRRRRRSRSRSRD